MNELINGWKWQMALTSKPALSHYTTSSCEGHPWGLYKLVGPELVESWVWLLLLTLLYTQVITPWETTETQPWKLAQDTSTANGRTWTQAGPPVPILNPSHGFKLPGPVDTLTKELTIWETLLSLALNPLLWVRPHGFISLRHIL